MLADDGYVFCRDIFGGLPWLPGSGHTGGGHITLKVYAHRTPFGPALPSYWLRAHEQSAIRMNAVGQPTTSNLGGTERPGEVALADDA